MCEMKGEKKRSMRKVSVLTIVTSTEIAGNKQLQQVCMAEWEKWTEKPEPKTNLSIVSMSNERTIERLFELTWYTIILFPFHSDSIAVIT